MRIFFYISCFFILFLLRRWTADSTVRQIGQEGVSATGNFPNTRDSIKPPLLMETARVIPPKKLNSRFRAMRQRADLSNGISPISNCICRMPCSIFSIIWCVFSCFSSRPVCILHTGKAWGKEKPKTGL